MKKEVKTATKMVVTPPTEATGGKLRCYIRTGYEEADLAHQIACYPQFLVVPYLCPHCNLFHLLFVKD